MSIAVDIREEIRLTGIAVCFRFRETPLRHCLETHKSAYCVSPLKSRVHIEIVYSGLQKKYLKKIKLFFREYLCQTVYPTVD